jgi:hypothetical protein
MKENHSKDKIMKFEVGKSYKDRAGREAQIFLLDNGDSMMIGAILQPFGSWSPYMWNRNGMCLTDTETNSDLVGEWEEPKIPKMLAYAIRMTGTRLGYMLSSSLYDSEDSARKALEGMFVSWPAIPNKDGMYEVPG